MRRQLAFDLPPQTTYARQDFFDAPANAAARAVVDDWAHWPGGKLLLTGAPGTGKTHLAHIWADEAGAELLPATALAGADISVLATRGAVAIEDADAIAGNLAAETALFHLHNLLVPEGRLLVTASTPPGEWGLALLDLASRLQAAPLARLEPPDDALLAAVLVKQFADRQIAVTPALISYLVTRAERSLAAARTLVAALDARALAEGRPVTRALAAEVLDSLGRE